MILILAADYHVTPWYKNNSINKPSQLYLNTIKPHTQDFLRMNDEDQTKPIPAFYVCYLLRSTVRHASLYIGSTPDPSRRLTQHNGVAKGGAKRTARGNLRPWEMTILVEGFTSRIGALQFEYAIFLDVGCA